MKVPIMGLASAVNSKDSKKGSMLHNFVFPVRRATKDLHSSFQSRIYVASCRTRIYTFVTAPAHIFHSKVASTRTIGTSVLEGLNIQAVAYRQTPGKAI